jgi:hypothetical protein
MWDKSISKKGSSAQACKKQACRKEKEQGGKPALKLCRPYFPKLD